MIHLSLYASARVSACQGFHLFGRHKVEVAVHRMLQSGCGNRKFKCFALVRFSQQTVDNAAGERVSSAYTVDNGIDRKSTRLNSSHANISYAVFCLKKKKH